MSITTTPPTLEQLKAWMREHDFTLGWDAIAAYDRTVVNRILTQEWIDKYDAATSLPPAEAQFEQQTPDQYLWLGGVTFAAPRLSFENSRLDASTATVTWQGVEGPIGTLLHRPFVGQPRHWELQMLRYENGLTGAKLVQPVDLQVAAVGLNDNGEVYLDLKQAHDPAIYSVLPPPEAQAHNGAQLVAWRARQPQAPLRFVLSTLSSASQLLFKPAGGAIRIHPGAQDGAVLVFAHAEGNPPGNYPNPDTYAYPVPRGYSASLAFGPGYFYRRLMALVVRSIARDSQLALAFTTPNGLITATAPAGVLKLTELPIVGGGVRLKFSPGQGLAFDQGAGTFKLCATTVDGQAGHLGLELTWAGSAQVAFTTARITGGPALENLVEVHWDVHYRCEYLEDAGGSILTATMQILPPSAIRVTPVYLADNVGSGNQEYPFLTYLQTTVFGGGVFQGRVQWNMLSPIALINGARLNSALFRGHAPVAVDTLRIARSLAAFGQACPGRARFSVVAHGQGEEGSQVLAGTTTKLTLEDTDANFKGVQWETKVVLGASKLRRDAGSVSGQGVEYTYTAPPASSMDSGYMMVRLSALGDFGDEQPYRSDVLLAIYRDAVQVAPQVCVLEKSLNLELAAVGVRGAALTAAVEDPAAVTGEVLAPRDASDGYGWQYLAPGNGNLKECNEPANPDKPRALDCRRLVFEQAGGGQGHCDVVVHYVDLNLRIVVEAVEPQPLRQQTLVTLKGFWVDGQAVTLAEHPRWAVLLGNATLQVQADGRALLTVPDALLRTHVVVEIRLFRSDQPSTAASAPPKLADHVGVRLFPVPWLTIQAPG